MNQTQLNLLHHPNVQLLIQALQLEPITPNHQPIQKIAARIDHWFDEFENPIQTHPFKPTEEINTLIITNRQKHGNAWCPF